MPPKIKKSTQVSKSLTKLDMRVFLRLESIKKIALPSQKNYFF